jgi:tyrosine-protein kinase Etk/Wzc
MVTRTPITELPEPLDPEDLPEPESARRAKDLSILDTLVVIADHRRAMAWIVAVITLLSIVVSFLLPRRYTATVTLLPPQQNSPLSAMLMSQLGGMGGSSGLSSLGGMAALAGSSLGLKNPNDRYVGMLRSRVVEDPVIQEFGLQKEYHKRHLSDARKKFEKRVEVDGNSKDGMIHISVEDSDPRRAQAIANAYVDQFRKLSEGLAVTEASQRRLFFEQQLEQAKNKLADAEEAMKQTQQSTGLIELDSQARALIQTVATLRAQIAAREMMIQGMQTFATGQNAQMIQAQQELDSLRAQLAKLAGNQESDDGLIVPKGLVPQEGLEYVRRLRDVKYYETIFEILARQFEMAKLDEAREGEIIQVVDPAMVPDKRSFPKRMYIVLGSFFGGLIIAILAAFGMESMKRMENDPESAAKLQRIYGAFHLRSPED